MILTQTLLKLSQRSRYKLPWYFSVFKDRRPRALWYSHAGLAPLKPGVFRPATSLPLGYALRGCRGGTVGEASNTWFQPRSWPRNPGIKPRVRLRAKHGICLRLSPLPLHPVSLCLCLSNRSIFKKKKCPYWVNVFGNGIWSPTFENYGCRPISKAS